jgi:NitT/TauT family transport system permease protein
MFKKFVFKAGSILSRFFAVFIFLLRWETTGRLGLVNKIFLPPFSKVMIALWSITKNGELGGHLFASLKRAVIGFSLGFSFAVILGLLIGWFGKFERFINPLLEVFRNTSVLALLPVFLLFFGIGEQSKIAMVFWGVMWAVLLNTIAGVRNIDSQIIRASRAMGMNVVMLFAKIIFPAAMPSIFTGIRLCATSSILVLTAAEMMAAKKGLGFALFFYEGNIMIPQMYAIIVVMSVLGVSVNMFLLALEKRLFRYREKIGTEV